MLNINLLPPKYRKKQFNLGNPTFAPIVLTSVILFCIISYNLLIFQNNFLKEELKFLNEQQKTLVVNIKSIENTQNQIMQIKNRFIQAIQRFSVIDAWFAELQVLEESVPKNIWFDSITYNAGTIPENSQEKSKPANTAENLEQNNNSENQNEQQAQNAEEVANGKIHEIKLYSFSYKDIASFIDKLKKSEKFEDVKIKSIDEKMYNRIEYIECVLVLKKKPIEEMFQ